MSWTTPPELNAQVQKLWDRGRLLASVVDDAELLFPLRLQLNRPGSADLSDRFDSVRAWSQALQQGSKTGYRLVWRAVRHRVIGNNAVPDEAWVDSIDDALRLIGKRRDAEVFAALLATTRTAQPVLLPWLRAHPLQALALKGEWPGLIELVGWLQRRPRPGVYLRQVDLAGLHSKFIEAHRRVLVELLDLALPASAIDASHGGLANFAGRYGFRAKPVRIRLRTLDPRQGLLDTGVDEDITLDQHTFMRLEPAAARVFITENEINFLAFPPLADSLVIFGSGYGFDAMAQAHWLHGRSIHYWGDIDTHGFAILDDLRRHFAQARSFLMDRATLLAHRSQWGDEPQPELRDLPRLDADERALFDALRWKRLGDAQVRLEQERIGFHWVEQALAELPQSGA